MVLTKRGCAGVDTPHNPAPIDSTQDLEILQMSVEHSEEQILSSMRWRLVGPHRGGRATAVAGHPDEAGTFYFGSCGGGVWKTTNGGDYWENISDGYFRTAAIGAIAISTSNPDVIYVGTGESTIRGNVSHGDGVYKSVDGGQTWHHLGLDDSRHISRIQIDPRNPDTVYVASLGHAWGTNTTRGVFRTQDGGRTWQRVLYKSDRAGACALSMDVNNPQVLFSGLWQVRRGPHFLSSGGQDSGIWRSVDGGDTWNELTHQSGFPGGIWGKIGIFVSPAKPGRVFALVEAQEGGLFLSDDYGETWLLVNSESKLRTRPWYFSHLIGDPVDADTIWVLNVHCWKSSNAGRTFGQITTPHGDDHDLWIDPANPKRMIEANDGGACVSFNGGDTWSSIMNQPTAQFYNVIVDNEPFYNLYGSQQDSLAISVPMADREGAITVNSYREFGGGEAGHIAIEGQTPNTVFSGACGTGLGHGRLIAWNPESGQKRNITVWPEVLGGGAGAADLKYRFPWPFPVHSSIHDSKALFVCSNFVHYSRDGGASWKTISPDLTRNDPRRMEPSGGPLTLDNSGTEVYCTIFSFAECSIESGVFWVGTDDGLVWLTRDGGANWIDVTPPDLPEWSLVVKIELSPSRGGTAYVAATRYKLNDCRPLIFSTNDYGKTWTSIVDGIEDQGIVRVVREDPERPDLLYAGTETGLYVSFSGGRTWLKFQNNLPVCPIYDLAVKRGDLVAATHGRSFWILDDLSPLHQLTDEVLASEVHFFNPRDAYRYRFYEWWAWGQVDDRVNYAIYGPTNAAFRIEHDETGAEQKRYLDAGSNPPNGATLYYFLHEAFHETVELRIKDDTGTEVAHFSSDSSRAPRLTRHQGLNRFVWDLTNNIDEVEKVDANEDRLLELFGDQISPRVPPGLYRAELHTKGHMLAQDLEVLPDPYDTSNPIDAQSQYAMKLRIRDMINTVDASIRTVERVREELHTLIQAEVSGTKCASRIADLGSALEEVDRVARGFTMSAPEQPRPELLQLREKLIALSSMIGEADYAPTDAERELEIVLNAQIREYLSLLNPLAAQVGESEIRLSNLEDGCA
jgi:photosystem II stability/assembly factor-like uncharacterized protein